MYVCISCLDRCMNAVCGIHMWTRMVVLLVSRMKAIGEFRKCAMLWFVTLPMCRCDLACISVRSYVPVNVFLLPLHSRGVRANTNFNSVSVRQSVSQSVSRRIPNLHYYHFSMCYHCFRSKLRLFTYREMCSERNLGKSVVLRESWKKGDGMLRWEVEEDLTTKSAGTS